MKTLVIALFTLMLATTFVSAEVLDPTLCTLDLDAAADGASVFVVPDGSGSPFTEAFLPGGGSVDATLVLSLITNFGNPVVGYPAEDLWLEADGLALCPGGGNPGGATDANGQATWTAPMAAGGYSTGTEVVAYVAGTAIPDSAPLLFNSADLTGDLQVNLSDISIFTQALGTYNWAADFNNDGVVNLSDISRFVPALGTVCD